MKFICAAILVASAFVTTNGDHAAAQPVAQPVPAAAAPVGASEAAAPLVATKIAPPTANTITMPANTELLLRLSQEVSSKLMREGDTFRVSLAQDVVIGNYVVLTKGTPGTGYISMRTGKGAFGKSAKMEITMRSLDLPSGRIIGLNGTTRQEGQGNTGATVGTAVAVGPFAAFVTGRSAIFADGRDVRGFTKEAVVFDTQ